MNLDLRVPTVQWDVLIAEVTRESSEAITMISERRTPHFSPGTRLGPYTLLRFLGRGSVGEVWLGERASELVPTQLALKLPYHSGAGIAEFRREAEVWIRASNHPNILPLFEANLYEGQIVLASEYAPDGSLEVWLERHGDSVPPLETGLRIAWGTLAGLRHLHERSIVHRDIKPANIMLQGDTPRLTDFGLARTLALDSSTSQIAGTPAYMAPEAFDGVRSVQSDLWSVGVMLYRLLTHRLPFSSDDLGTLVQLIRRQHPTPLPSSVPLQIRSAVLHALEKDPDKRYSTALEMEQALRADVRTPTAVLLEQSDPAAASDTTKQQAVADTSTSLTGVPRLVVGSGRSAGTVYRIDKERVLIGRDRSCDVKLDTELVSRMQAQLVQTDDGFAIEDLGSSNGTFVNGMRVRGRVALHDYDRIHVGQVILVYRTSDEEPRDSHGST